jgi:hypothetical protein
MLHIGPILVLPLQRKRRKSAVTLVSGSYLLWKLRTSHWKPMCLFSVQTCHPSLNPVTWQYLLNKYEFDVFWAQSEICMFPVINQTCFKTVRVNEHYKPAWKTPIIQLLWWQQCPYLLYSGSIGIRPRQKWCFLSSVWNVKDNSKKIRFMLKFWIESILKKNKQWARWHRMCIFQGLI